MDDGSAFLQIFLINLYGTRYLFLTGLEQQPWVRTQAGLTGATDTCNFTLKSIPKQPG